MKKSYEINPRVGWRCIDDEIVAFNCDNQQIIIWNETASELWKMLYDGASRGHLIDWIINEYSIATELAESDVNRFLNEAGSMNFIMADNFLSDNLADHDFDGGENVLLAIEMKAIDKLIPFAVTFETTYTCNEWCIHCFMERNLPSLEFSKIKIILDGLANEGCLFLSLTGGEFFTRRDAVEIIEYASGLHFVIDILSNGTLITRDLAEKLSCRPVRRLQISLYGATPETHDAITKLPGSFEKTVAGIRLLRGAGVKVEVAFPLMNQNFNERFLVKQLAESMGCAISPSHIITARNNGSTDTFSLRINDKQLREFLEDREFSNLYAGRKPFQDHQFYFGFSDIMNAAPCYSGFNSCAISPSGKVYPCNQLLHEVGDLNHQTFSEIWHYSIQLQQLRNLKIRDLTKCSSCSMISECARCPGLALLEGGQLLEPSPENCRVTTIYSEIQRKEVMRQ